jgi:hypothetical protein
VKVRKDDVVFCFRVIASDRRRSSVWRAWSGGDDVYLSPYAKRYYFKISLHKSGDWRMAFDSDYAERLRQLGTWPSHRCFDKIRRPVLGHAAGFTRGVRIYFPESELRSFTESWEETATEPIQDVPACPSGQVRVVDLIFTNEKSRFSEQDWPLRASVGAERMKNWKLPNGEMVWLVHFCWTAVAQSLEAEADWYRRNLCRAKKLDDRCAIDFTNARARIMIAGTNENTWFAVIDAAAA